MWLLSRCYLFPLPFKSHKPEERSLKIPNASFQRLVYCYDSVKKKKSRVCVLMEVRLKSSNSNFYFQHLPNGSNGPQFSTNNKDGALTGTYWSEDWKGLQPQHRAINTPCRKGTSVSKAKPQVLSSGTDKIMKREH